MLVMFLKGFRSMPYSVQPAVLFTGNSNPEVIFGNHYGLCLKVMRGKEQYLGHGTLTQAPSCACTTIIY